MQKSVVRSKAASMTRLGRGMMAVALVVSAVVPTGAVLAHGTDARYVQVMNWQRQNFSRAFVTNRTHFAGISNSNFLPLAHTKELEGKSCIVGDNIALDVDDRFAFDIDEAVTLTVTYATEFTMPFVVAWDKSGGLGQGLTETIEPQPGNTFSTATVTLDRARFAGLGTQGADIAIATPGDSGVTGALMICDVKIARSNTTKATTDFGTVELVLKDAKTGASVPARIGLYDSTGRAPLPSEKALLLQRFADDLRMVLLNERTFWPSENRQVFYADSSYAGQVPAGRYELIVARGMEYRVHRSYVDVKKDQVSKITVALERYADMPAAGWYSGDTHIHVARTEVADPTIWGFVAAENLHVGNLLEMDNIGKTHFKQPQAWGKASRFERDGHFIVSGQEGPRTSQFGHTVHLDIQRPIRLESEEYFLYDKVFEESQRQGGISGFAHKGWSGGAADGSSPGKMTRGVVLLAPFGLVNFIEVLQGGHLTSEGWYRLLNLGYRITPAAGTDWPYSDLPGIVRYYVNTGGALNLDTWFKSFQAGHAFVTNGPLLEFTVNGKGMGEELRVKRGTRLNIAAAAKLNPDVDSLDRLELVVLGDVTDTKSAAGKDSVTFSKQITVDRSMWIAVRAHGGRQDPRNMTIAHTAPIYVVVDNEPTWNREKAPQIVAELRTQLERMLIEPVDQFSTNPWETRVLETEQWPLQRVLLKPRVNAADAAYQKILDQLAKYSGPSASAAQ